METSLHRQLKQHYTDSRDQQEVTIDGYRIDVVRGQQLIEIQHASLAAIETKVGHLLNLGHEVLVVKPIAARKYLIKRSRQGGSIVSQRFSPKRESIYILFLELVHFVRAFPHPNLKLEVVLAEVEEDRLPPKKRTRKKYRVSDRRLRNLVSVSEFRTVADLMELLPDRLPDEFTTADVAEHAEIPRWLAQKMAYCLRKIGGIIEIGKVGNSRIYRASA